MSAVATKEHPRKPANARPPLRIGDTVYFWRWAPDELPPVPGIVTLVRPDGRLHLFVLEPGFPHDEHGGDDASHRSQGVEEVSATAPWRERIGKWSHRE